MFEDNHNDFDLMMKNILENGQEKVPARIWDGISADLDRAAARKKVVALWWRRAAVSASVAAALAIGVIIHQGSDVAVDTVADVQDIEVIVPETTSESKEDMGVSEQDTPHVSFTKAAEHLIAEGPEPTESWQSLTDARSAIEAESSQAQEDVQPQQNISEDLQTKKSRAGQTDENISEYDTDFWKEDDVKRRKVRTSVVISGIAGSNNPKIASSIGPMKRPAATFAPKKTTITESSTNTTYGIPVSLGAGVRIGFNDRWSLGVGLNWTLLSRKFSGQYTPVTDGQVGTTITSDIRNTQHYIGIPINVFCNLLNNDYMNFYTYAGGTIERCLADKYQLLGHDITHSEAAKGVQLSANAGLGVEFIFGHHIGLYVDPSIRYYFNCRQPKSVRTVQPLMLGFEMGLRFRL